MDREIFREAETKKLYNSIEKLKIGVIGIGEGVGTTFVSTSLAFCFAKKGKSVAFAEVGNPRTKLSILYDSVAMDLRFSNREFVDFYNLIMENLHIRGKKNIEEGINWALITPKNLENGKELDESEKLRLVNNLSGEIVIFDLEAFEAFGTLLEEMDIIVGVIDPLPSKMIGGFKIFQALKKLEIEGQKVIWVVNKNNKGIGKKHIYDYLKTREILWIPFFELEQMYLCEYNCIFPIKNKKLNCQIIEAFDRIIDKTGLFTKPSH